METSAGVIKTGDCVSYINNDEQVYYIHVHVHVCVMWFRSMAFSQSEAEGAMRHISP